MITSDARFKEHMYSQVSKANKVGLYKTHTKQ